MAKKTNQPNAEPPSGFGEQLRQIRKQRGWSQASLATRLGVHVTTVSRLERGDQEPTWPLVLRVAREAGVSTDAFRPAGDLLPGGDGPLAARIEEAIRVLRGEG